MAVTVAARMTEEAYQAFALTDAGKLVELWDGEPREKPAMSGEHGDVATTLILLLGGQLDRRRFRLRSNHGRVRHAGGSYYIPDVAVIPTDYGRDLRGRPDRLEFYDAPLPLVVEVWSPSTGAYDLREKLVRYQERGDEEIWYLHPYERTLTAWVRQPDGSCQVTVHREGVVHPVSLPGVAIALDDVFAD